MPWTEEPGGLQPLGLRTVGHDGAYLHALGSDEVMVGGAGRMMGLVPL